MFVAPRFTETAQPNPMNGVATSQEYVGGFEITMDDALLMSVMHGPGQDFQQLSYSGGWLRRTVELLGQCASFDVLQREVGHARPLAHFVDLHDIGMLQTGGGLGLAAETKTFP